MDPRTPAEIQRPAGLDDPAAQDADPQETREWLDALASVIAHSGSARAAFLLDRLVAAARPAVGVRTQWFQTPYANTIAPAMQPAYPGDLALEQRIVAAVRWNALAMVMRANRESSELGGHIASYASSAELFEAGFLHHFHGPREGAPGDLVFFQPHSAPGVYSRAYLEGRLCEADLAHYRREVQAPAVGARGLSSYPHPWLMPDFWQFPTGSMGLGPLQAIFQARFMKYLEHRGLLQAGARKVWGFFGDGEMDEPESIAALTLAARERVDNLVFVVNCNLQRLDGPVRGNGQIVQELEALFAGAGWNVIKVLWGSDWDALFARDAGGALPRAFAAMVDGEFQTLSARDGRYNREHFFQRTPELAALVADWSDAQIERLHRGGHDLAKIHAAFAAARSHRGQPTVVLAKTMKGYGMGAAGQGLNITHQQKKLERAELLAFRDRFGLPLSDEQVERLEFWRPAPESAEMRHLAARRAAMGGALPARCSNADPVPVPTAAAFDRWRAGSGERAVSTTTAFVQMLTQLVRDPQLGPRVVPIVADEARTFGMQTLFREIGIYAPEGQRYTPEDAGSLLYYREERSGQILEEGISEAGALASWIAAGTAYSTHGLAMLPVFIYYSMFGFQRVGDLIWAAADQRARGLLVGATSGRTTLSGEGLQHQDGTSHLIAATVPNCRAWDPCCAGELAVIVPHAVQRLMTEGRDEFHYLTVTNENLPQPAVPADAADDILRGMWRLCPAPEGMPAAVRLLASGAIVAQAVQAARWLHERHGIAAEVWSVTSWSELARDGMACERQHRLEPSRPAPAPYLRQRLGGHPLPLVAASDYVRAVPEQIRAYTGSPAMVTLGTDGFGRSDTRAAMRAFFEVDAEHLVRAALQAMELAAALRPEQRLAAAPAPATGHAAPPWQR
ncbi:MAG: pyruvate dehydrogenase (acetyl-transferring), homodimeric type [Aquabacterium sp.]|nr:pyruvate dehydrogenase (acetyl-transferring), homodimeric type [Aquabacterium sp.]